MSSPTTKARDTLLGNMIGGLGKPQTGGGHPVKQPDNKTRMFALQKWLAGGNHSEEHRPPIENPVERMSAEQHAEYTKDYKYHGDTQMAILYISIFFAVVIFILIALYARFRDWGKDVRHKSYLRKEKERRYLRRRGIKVPSYDRFPYLDDPDNVAAYKYRLMASHNPSVGDIKPKHYGVCKAIRSPREFLAKLWKKDKEAKYTRLKPWVIDERFPVRKKPSHVPMVNDRFVAAGYMKDFNDSSESFYIKETIGDTNAVNKRRQRSINDRYGIVQQSSRRQDTERYGDGNIRDPSMYLQQNVSGDEQGRNYFQDTGNVHDATIYPRQNVSYDGQVQRGNYFQPNVSRTEIMPLDNQNQFTNIQVGNGLPIAQANGQIQANGPIQANSPINSNMHLQPSLLITPGSFHEPSGIGHYDGTINEPSGGLNLPESNRGNYLSTIAEASLSTYDANSTSSRGNQSLSAPRSVHEDLIEKSVRARLYDNVSMGSSRSDTLPDGHQLMDEPAGAKISYVRGLDGSTHQVVEQVRLDGRTHQVVEPAIECDYNSVVFQQQRLRNIEESYITPAYKPPVKVQYTNIQRNESNTYQLGVPKVVSDRSKVSIEDKYKGRYHINENDCEFDPPNDNPPSQSALGVTPGVISSRSKMSICEKNQGRSHINESDGEFDVLNFSSSRQSQPQNYNHVYEFVGMKDENKQQNNCVGFRDLEIPDAIEYLSFGEEDTFRTESEYQFEDPRQIRLYNCGRNDQKPQYTSQIADDEIHTEAKHKHQTQDEMGASGKYGTHYTNNLQKNDNAPYNNWIHNDVKQNNCNITQHQPQQDKSCECRNIIPPLDFSFLNTETQPVNSGLVNSQHLRNSQRSLNPNSQGLENSQGLLNSQEPATSQGLKNSQGFHNFCRVDNNSDLFVDMDHLSNRSGYNNTTMSNLDESLQTHENNNRKYELNQNEGYYGQQQPNQSHKIPLKQTFTHPHNTEGHLQPTNLESQLGKYENNFAALENKYGYLSRNNVVQPEYIQPVVNNSQNQVHNFRLTPNNILPQNQSTNAIENQLNASLSNPINIINQSPRRNQNRMIQNNQSPVSTYNNINVQNRSTHYSHDSNKLSSMSECNASNDNLDNLKEGNLQTTSHFIVDENSIYHYAPLVIHGEVK